MKTGLVCITFNVQRLVSHSCLLSFILMSLAWPVLAQVQQVEELQ